MEKDILKLVRESSANDFLNADRGIRFFYSLNWRSFGDKRRKLFEIFQVSPLTLL